MLSDFFRINLPYGLAKNEEGGWMAFNREYLPLGFNSKKALMPAEDYFYPIYTKYRLTTNTIEELAWGEEGIRKNDKGEIVMFWLYNDSTNPMGDGGKKKAPWEDYFAKLQRLAKLKKI